MVLSKISQGWTRYGKEEWERVWLVKAGEGVVKRMGLSMVSQGWTRYGKDGWVCVWLVKVE